MSIKDKATILDLLNKIVQKNTGISWKMKCLFSDGKGNTLNQITLLRQSDKRSIGIFTYQVESGEVQFCNYKDLKKPKSENIIDLLLDVMNDVKSTA